MDAFFDGTSGRNHCQTLKIQWYLSNEICTDTHLRDCCGKDNLEKLYWDLDGKKYQIGNAFFVHRKQGLFLSVYVDDIKLAGRKKNLNPMWKKFMKLVDLGEPTSFLDQVYLGCARRECKSNESVIEKYRKCSYHESLLELLKNIGFGKSSRENRRFVLRQGRSCLEMRGKILRIGE